MGNMSNIVSTASNSQQEYKIVDEEKLEKIVNELITQVHSASLSQVLRIRNSAKSLLGMVLSPQLKVKLQYLLDKAYERENELE